MDDVAVGKRFLALPADWPNIEPEPIGGWAGTIAALKKDGTVAVLFDSDKEKYDFPEGVAQAQTLPSSDQVVPTKAQLKKTDDAVEVYVVNDVVGKGVRAKRTLERDEFLAVYPGRVYTNADWQRASRKHLVNSKYAVGTFELVTIDGAKYIKDGGVVLDPSIGTGLDPMFERSVAPYLNEPAVGTPANAYWVYNIRTGHLEVWTFSRIKKGDPVTICYGDTYPRSWKSSCETEWIARGYLLPGRHLPVQKKDMKPVVQANGTVEWVTYGKHLPKPRDAGGSAAEARSKAVTAFERYQRRTFDRLNPQRAPVQLNTLKHHIRHYLDHESPGEQTGKTLFAWANSLAAAPAGSSSDAAPPPPKKQKSNHRRQAIEELKNRAAEERKKRNAAASQQQQPPKRQRLETHEQRQERLQQILEAGELKRKADQAEQSARTAELVAKYPELSQPAKTSFLTFQNSAPPREQREKLQQLLGAEKKKRNAEIAKAVQNARIAAQAALRARIPQAARPPQILQASQNAQEARNARAYVKATKPVRNAERNALNARIAKAAKNAQIAQVSKSPLNSVMRFQTPVSAAAPERPLPHRIPRATPPTPILLASEPTAPREHRLRAHVEAKYQRNKARAKAEFPFKKFPDRLTYESFRKPYDIRQSYLTKLAMQRGIRIPSEEYNRLVKNTLEQGNPPMFRGGLWRNLTEAMENNDNARRHPEKGS